MNDSQPTRRSFLRGQAGPGAPGHSAASDGCERIDRSTVRLDGEDAGGDSFLVSVRRRAMACEFEVQMAASRHDDAMECVLESLDLVEALEAQMTIYRPGGEVMRINHEAGERPVRVESRLFEVFQLAERIHRDTSGALDITSGPLSDAWGFSRREGRLPSDEEVSAALSRTGMENVLLDASQQTIAFRRRGICVNLNSIGKGYALDRMAEMLAANSIDDYLLHGGKSSVLARGDQPGNPEASGWRIGVRHPLYSAQRLAEFVLRDQALSTSGSGTQFFTRRGRRYGHILDPRTGRPAEGLFSATAVASTAAEAEALSTAFYVMGPDRVGQYCENHPGIGALLVARGDREGDVRLLDFGLGDGQWQQQSGG